MSWINESEIAPYLKDIRKIKVLTRTEEVDLISKLSDGPEKTMESLVCANLRFVITVAKEYQYRGLEFKDLISEGNYGLVKAVKRFNADAGVRFYSYAVHWVRQSIMQALNDNGRTIRLPVNVINDKIKNRREMDENGYANWCIYQGVNPVKSLSQRIGESGDELSELIPNDEDISDYGEMTNGNSLAIALDEVMNILDKRERSIITQYYGLKDEALTLQQIAVNFNLTKERVRQIKNQAIKKLRFNAPLLFKFFED